MPQKGPATAHSVIHSLPVFYIYLVDVSDIFYFFLFGKGEGRVRGAGGGGGGSIFHWKSQEGVGVPGGEGPRGREGVCGELGNLGGAKYFFRGRNVHQDLAWCVIAQAFCSQKSFREITQNYAKLR